MLASMALEEKNYQNAENYIKMFDEKFPYQHFCGNEWAAYNMFKAVMTAQVYSGMNQPQKAISTLLPYTFSNALASNEEVLKVLETTLTSQFTKEEIEAELLKAIESLQVKRRNSRTKSTMILFGVKVELDDFFMDNEPNESELEHYKRLAASNELFRKYLH
jgi:hypothetical protein